MQGYIIMTGTDAIEAVCVDCTHSIPDFDSKETSFIGPNAKFEVKCSTCDDLINGKGTTFEVVGAAADVVTSWYRKVNVYYDGNVYAIELSYDHCNGYEWSELNDLPAELCDLLNEADLYYLDEDIRAMQNK